MKPTEEVKSSQVKSSQGSRFYCYNTSKRAFTGVRDADYSGH